MQKGSITDRIQYLRDAIAYSRYEGKGMSISQGICCNQEIAAWFKILHDLEFNESSITEPKYIIPNHLENRVTLIHVNIKQEDWHKPQIL